MIEEVQSVVIEQQGSKWWSFYKSMKKLRQKDCTSTIEERANEGVVLRWISWPQRACKCVRMGLRVWTGRCLVRDKHFIWPFVLEMQLMPMPSLPIISHSSVLNSLNKMLFLINRNTTSITNRQLIRWLLTLNLIGRTIVQFPQLRLEGTENT
jgi:hypothetical protein